MTELEIDQFLSEELFTRYPEWHERCEQQDIADWRFWLIKYPYDMAVEALRQSRAKTHTVFKPTPRPFLEIANAMLKATQPRRSYRNIDQERQISFWITCYFVCEYTDGTNDDIWPGRLLEMCYPSKYSQAELRNLMARDVRETFQGKYQWGMCHFRFYMGEENHRTAKKEAAEIFARAKADGLLPDRFYERDFQPIRQSAPPPLTLNQNQVNKDDIPF